MTRKALGDRAEFCMRIVAAMLKHETNTFSPVPTPVGRFGADGPLYGADALEALRGTNNAMAAFIDAAEEAGADLVTPLAADAFPSGKVERSAFEHMAQTICGAINDATDIVLLDLHGAMVTESLLDGEGELLERVRRLAPRAIIAVALDLHANLTERMVENADVLVGYRTYPHIDMYDTGRRAAKIALAAYATGSRPVIIARFLPLMAHTLRMASDDEPMRCLLAEAAALEGEGVLAATLFGGFPLADIPRPGVSIVLVGDAKSPALDAAADGLANAVWARRADLIYAPPDLAISLDEAARQSKGPILLIDHADNCASGGTQDTMALVEAVMQRGLQDVIVGSIVDPEAVLALQDAGVGGAATLDLGGKTDIPSLGLSGRPLRVSGTVLALSDGRFVVRGPMSTGDTINLGPSALFQVGELKIVVASRHSEPFDLGVFELFGLRPEASRYILLKSRVHYRAAFASITQATVYCEGEGVTSSHHGRFPFTRLQRPIYPFDEMAGVLPTVWAEPK